MKLNIKNFTNNLKTKIKFETNPAFAIAVSGGPDSMVLLHLLNAWNKTIKGNLTILIVNHNIRDNSSEEAYFVKNLLKKFKKKIKILEVNFSLVSKKNMEEARLNRYNMLTNFCKKNNILYLFVAHHKDDNLETFLYRKIAGSDFEGLQGINYLSINNKTMIVRPLLDFSKKQILHYAKKNYISYIEDPSNINFNFTRPIIRNFISNLTSRTRENIHRDFLKVRNNYELYNRMIYELLIFNLVEIKRTAVKVNFTKLVKLHDLLLERLIRKIYQYLFDNNSHLRSSKIKSLIDILNDQNFRSFNIKGMMVKKVNKSLIFEKKN